MIKAFVLGGAAALLFCTSAVADTREDNQIDQRIGAPIGGDDGAGLQKSPYYDTSVEGRRELRERLLNDNYNDARARYGGETYSTDATEYRLVGRAISERRVAGGTVVYLAPGYRERPRK
jgi:hypothetical protein